MTTPNATQKNYTLNAPEGLKGVETGTELPVHPSRQSLAGQINTDDKPHLSDSEIEAYMKTHDVAQPLERFKRLLLGRESVVFSALSAGQRQQLIKAGERLFFKETFKGNGRTCGTCHPRENNFTLDPAFIAKLPPNDPLFVAENNPDLRDLEKPELMRRFALILENLDGFSNPGLMRGVPHTLGLRTSVESAGGARTGWSGDGAPGDGSLRSFAIGAVVQHAPRTLKRIEGKDFRLPTEDELDALEAFQLSLGRQADLQLPLPLKGVEARRGQEIFLDDGRGKCNRCHANAGATARFAPGQNLNFNTGVEDLPDHPARRVDPAIPVDDGFGTPGNKTFNTPSLVEMARTPPFFHNNAIRTVEGAVAFYNSQAFSQSPAGIAVGGIDLEPIETEDVAAFLRVIGALDSIRGSNNLLLAASKGAFRRRERVAKVQQAINEIGDAIRVLSEVNLHPEAVASLTRAKQFAAQSLNSDNYPTFYLRKAIEQLELARAELVDVTALDKR